MCNLLCIEDIGLFVSWYLLSSVYIEMQSPHLKVNFLICNIAIVIINTGVF